MTLVQARVPVMAFGRFSHVKALPTSAGGESARSAEETKSPAVYTVP